FFEKQRLTGPNFIDWYRNLQIVLSVEDKLPFLKQPIPAMPVPPARQELLQTVIGFHTCKQEEGQSKKNHKNKKPQLAARGNNQGKGKSKIGYAPKPKIPPPPKKDYPTKDAFCHQYGDGLRGSRKLKPGALSLYVGDGHRAAVEAIGSYHLCLPSGRVLILHNCHYAPSITKGIILVFCLYDNGFINHFENNTISVSRNNVVYFSVVSRNGTFEIDLSNFNTNDSSMYVVGNKISNTNLDSTLLWHCRLRHISKKRIEKLQHDGLLNSTDNPSFDKCVSCMSGKMAQKPYIHQVKRAKDLPVLIYTDVCGPFKTVSKQRARYFVTFTNEFSCYGYVYLLMHKHEVFETFKAFQKEVENQPVKTIKSLRSNRGGKYISQEFLDHLKEHEIIAHRTPLYTPQHNGVSEKRNRTLLNMVRSMMTQTTLPKQEVWDLDDLSPDGKTVGSKWIFKKKTEMDGTVHTYKARLVAKGFTQTYGVDYEETFAHVADIRAIKILVAIVTFYDYEIWQMDVKTIFLNGHLFEEVYMVQPEGALTPTKVQRIQRVPYASAVESIMYAVRCTHPDVAFAQNIKSRFQHNPGDIKRELRVACYTDARYLTNVDDYKSQIGYVFVLNGGVVDWKSTKQSIFATSSAEAEYIASYDASKEAVWILGLALFPQIKII
nr:hypothetical protein [Tanacetum cinerariifolium]